MIAIKNPIEVREFVVIHPMFDVAEEKHDGSGLGYFRMSPAVRFGLVLLRAYIIGVGFLLAYHVLDIAGVFGRHLTKS